MLMRYAGSIINHLQHVGAVADAQRPRCTSYRRSHAADPVDHLMGLATSTGSRYHTRQGIVYYIRSRRLAKGQRKQYEQAGFIAPAGTVRDLRQRGIPLRAEWAPHASVHAIHLGAKPFARYDRADLRNRIAAAQIIAGARRFLPRTALSPAETGRALAYGLLSIPVEHRQLLGDPTAVVAYPVHDDMLEAA